jgi:hypothetical protein
VRARQCDYNKGFFPYMPTLHGYPVADEYPYHGKCLCDWNRGFKSGWLRLSDGDSCDCKEDFINKDHEGLCVSEPRSHRYRQLWHVCLLVTPRSLFVEARYREGSDCSRTHPSRLSRQNSDYFSDPNATGQSAEPASVALTVRMSLPQWCSPDFTKKYFKDEEEYLIGCVNPEHGYDPYEPYSYPRQYYDAEATESGETEEMPPQEETPSRNRHRLQSVVSAIGKKKKVQQQAQVVIRHTQTEEVFTLPPGHFRFPSAADFPDLEESEMPPLAPSSN